MMRLIPFSRRALVFCENLVQVYRNLNTSGQKVLRGRLTDALQAETGFASLYQEIELGSWLMSKGFEVEFPDLDGSGSGLIKFSNGPLIGHVECKALSPDAGRKIHRKHFYRFMDALSHELLLRKVMAGANEFLVITLMDRLNKDIQHQSRLLEAVLRMLHSNDVSFKYSDFIVERHNYPHWVGGLEGLSTEDFYSQARRDFGQDSHMAGFQYESGRCYILMRSQKPDDASKPKFEVMEKAAEQLPKDKPGFISLQLADISSTDLALPHLRERLVVVSMLSHSE